jgi:hypothetical protein
MRFSPTLLAASLLGPTLLAGAPAQAQPMHHHPGTACKPNNGDVAKINYTDNQGVMNVSTSSSAKVYCPVDHTLDPNGILRPASLRVMVIDRSGEAVSCTLKNVTADGTDVQTIGPLNSNGNTSTPQALTFTIPPPGVSPRGYLNLICTLPRAGSSTTRSHVVSYKLIMQ